MVDFRFLPQLVDVEPDAEVASKADAYTERWDEWEERPNCDIPAGMRRISQFNSQGKVW